MNKYDKVYMGYEPGSEEWTTKNGEYEVIEVEAKNCPEDTDGWNSPHISEMLDTIVDAGKKLIREAGYGDNVANNLYNIFWTKFSDETPLDTDHGKEFLIVVYMDTKKKFVTTSAIWNADLGYFDFYKDNVVYWAEMPAPPVQI